VPEAPAGIAPSRAKLVAAFAAVYVLWGSTYLAIRYAIETMPPLLMAGCRFVVAGSILYAVARRTAPAPTAAEWRAGALLGGLAGNMLDQRDKRMAAEAQQKALESAPTGTPVAWNNPDSGHSASITPTKTYQSGGTYCREFQSDVIIDGKPDKAWGTACRQPDGSWKVQG